MCVVGEIMPEFLQMKVCTKLWSQWDKLVYGNHNDEVVSSLICLFVDGSWSHMKCLLNSPSLVPMQAKVLGELEWLLFWDSVLNTLSKPWDKESCQKESFASFFFYFCVNIPGKHLSYFWNSCMEFKLMESSTPLVSSYLGKVCSSQ